MTLFRKAPLGVGGIFVFGLALGALVGAGPIFADKSGLTTAELSIFMASISLGCVILLWPMGALADRFDRSKILVVMAVLSALVALAIAVLPTRDLVFLFLLAGVFAGLSNSIYPLCVAITNDKLEADEMVGCGMTLFICYSVGATLGPVISTEIMEAWNPSAFFIYLAGVHVLIAVYAIALIARRRHTPVRRQRPLARSVLRRSYWVTPSWMEWSSESEKSDH